ncbi:hypothetical protein BJV82DRAFT_634586 [Fennellomyces sp. T-0311]|nr:hypothetical protein BJV82DRAFT_634586 [Fennellomyces sp. T-0311]
MSVTQHIFNHSDWTSCIQLFETQAARYHNRTFIHYQTSDRKLVFRTITYRQFNNMANYQANKWLPQLDGVQCIAFLGGDPLQSLLAMAAISKLGRTFFPLSTGNSVSATAH